MELTFPFFAGVLASMLHVIAGPDHLAAVTPFAIESKKKAWKIGLFWGIGHLGGMLAIGILFLLFKELIPIEKISEYSEQFVGVILIVLGVWIFLKIFITNKKHIHTHIHTQNSVLIHKHAHNHSTNTNHSHTHKNVKQGVIASLSFGFIHGLAGVAHFLLFLPVIGFSTQFDSMKYIIGFGVGTILAMVAFAFVIGKIANLSKQDHNDLFFKGIRFAGGLFAFIVGIYWLTVS